MADFDFAGMPSFQTKSSIDLRTLDAQMGDGYVQTSADGLNNITEIWILEFTNQTPAAVLAIENFILSMAGYQSFTWTLPTPWSTGAKFRCKKVPSRTFQAGLLRGVSLEFIRVFQP